MQGVTAQNIPSIQIDLNSNLKIITLLDTGASCNVVIRKLFDILNKKGLIIKTNLGMAKY